MGRRGRNACKQEDCAKEKLWKIAVYIRLSKEDGNDISKSVNNQKAIILDYISGFEEAYEIENIYIDDGCTGTDTDRDGFQRMLTAIREHKVNCVIVKDLSRLSRNLADVTYHLENTFVEYDVRFISLELPVLDSYKYPEHMNSLAVPIQNVINDDFCRQTSVKIRGVLNSKRRNGKFIGAFAPYGYGKSPADKHKLVIDEEAAAVVRDIYDWYINDGLSKNNIARKLNERGIANPTAYKKQKGLKYSNPYINMNDGKWNPKTISDILSNMMYAGHMVQGKYRVKSYKVHSQIATPKEEWFIVKNTHEAVIEPELFNKAQDIRKKDTRTPPAKKNIYLLSGYVRCGDCGKSMIRTASGGEKKYTYYKCRTNRDKLPTACSPHTIRAEKLEEAVFNAISKQIEIAADIKQIINEAYKAKNKTCESKRLKSIEQAKESELERLIKIKDGLFKDWKNGDITQQEYHRFKAEYEREAESLTETINRLKTERHMETNEITNFTVIKEYGKVNKPERAMVVNFIEAVYVYESGKINIEFSYMDQYKRLLSNISGGCNNTQ